MRVRDGPPVAEPPGPAAVPMSAITAERVREILDGVYRSESRRILATLIRLLGDFDLAEEALHDAFIAAVKQWPRDGVPDNPTSVAGVDRPVQGD